MKPSMIAVALSMCVTVALAAPASFEIAGNVTAISYSADATVLEIDGGSYSLFCTGFTWCDRFQIGDTATFSGTVPPSDSDGNYVIKGFSVVLLGDDENPGDGDEDEPGDGDR